MFFCFLFLLGLVVCLTWGLCWGAFLPLLRSLLRLSLRRFLVCVQVFTRSETFANQVLIKTSRTIGVGPSDKFKPERALEPSCSERCLEMGRLPECTGAVMLSAQFETGPSCPSWSQDQKSCQCRRVSAHPNHCRALTSDEGSWPSGVAHWHMHPSCGVGVAEETAGVASHPCAKWFLVSATW